jgi:ABC-2 type transport system permease protein
MSLMAEWVQQVSSYLPFKWSFQFPIESLVGQLSPQQLFSGLGMQLVWIVGGIFFVNVVWKLGVQRFSAVGN